MILVDDLPSLIASGEGAKTEFKRNDDSLRPEHIAKEIVSFANMNGGEILLGVEDDGEVSGINRENVQAWLMDTVIGRYINPQIIPDYEEMTLDGKIIGVISVPMGVAKTEPARHSLRCATRKPSKACGEVTS